MSKDELNRASRMIDSDLEDVATTFDLGLPPTDEEVAEMSRRMSQTKQHNIEDGSDAGELSGGKDVVSAVITEENGCDQ